MMLILAIKLAGRYVIFLHFFDVEYKHRVSQIFAKWYTGITTITTASVCIQL